MKAFDDKRPIHSTSALIMPGWWARAYGSLYSSGFDPSQKLNQGAADPSIYPLRDTDTLNFWAMMIDECQRKMQLPEFRVDKEIRLEWKSCQKRFGSEDPHSTVFQQKCFEDFLNLRLIAPRAPSRRMVHGVFDRRVHLQGDLETAELCIRVDSWAQEVLSGVSDGHNEALRALSGDPCVSDFLGEDAPLSVRKPAWLDLGREEQLLYFRLEQLMQWETTQSLLHLEGVYAADLQELFKGLKIPDQVLGAHSPLMERLRILGRLGRKLVEHGILAWEPESSFYACSRASEGQEPRLLWQANRDRSKSDEQRDFFGQLFEAFRRSSGIEALIPLWQAIAPRASTSGLDLHRLWMTISEFPGGVFRVGPTRVIQVHNLFFEWSIRRASFSDIALSDEIRSFEIASYCRLQGDIAADFRQFMDLVQANPDEVQGLLESPLASIGLSGDFNNSPLLFRIREAIRMENASTTVLSDEKKSILAPIIQVESITPTTEQKRSNGEVSETRLLSLSESKMVRIAHDELEKMLKSDPRAYESLKQNYMKSLEDSQRSLMLDFQRRMKAPLFEQQLKQRLVRFMVSHPGEWKSTRSPLQ